MADALVPGQVAYGTILWLRHLWHSWRKHRVGIYGYWGTGKTTLNRQISTPGELEVIEHDDEETSTYHAYNQKQKKYVLPAPSTKRVKLHANELVAASRTIVTTDIGGHDEYFDLWLEDMVTRKVQIVIWLIDHRHLQDPNNTSQQEAFTKFVDCLVTGKYPFKSRKLRRMARGYRPKIVGLVANKADLWVDNKWMDHYQTARIGDHQIFSPFREDLMRIQRHLMVPTLKRSCSALKNWNVERVIWDLLQSKG